MFLHKCFETYPCSCCLSRNVSILAANRSYVVVDVVVDDDDDDLSSRRPIKTTRSRFTRSTALSKVSVIFGMCVCVCVWTMVFE